MSDNEDEDTTSYSRPAAKRLNSSGGAAGAEAGAGGGGTPNRHLVQQYFDDEDDDEDSEEAVEREAQRAAEAIREKARKRASTNITPSMLSTASRSEDIARAKKLKLLGSDDADHEDDDADDEIDDVAAGVLALRNNITTPQQLYEVCMQGTHVGPICRVDFGEDVMRGALEVFEGRWVREDIRPKKAHKHAAKCLLRDAEITDDICMNIHLVHKLCNDAINQVSYLYTVFQVASMFTDPEDAVMLERRFGRLFEIICVGRYVNASACWLYVSASACWLYVRR
jgi:hypothetical protein